MMKNVFTMKQQAQDFLLRLFVGPDGEYSSPSSSCYTGAHCGTFSRMKQ